MGEGVIADYVSALRYGERDVGSLLHVASDHKECRVHVVFCKNIEQLQRVRIVRSIVVGKGNSLASLRATANRLPKPLSRWRYGLVACGRSGDCGCQSEESWKHERL